MPIDGMTEADWPAVVEIDRIERRSTTVGI
jgi:hypothetical protein